MGTEMVGTIGDAPQPRRWHRCLGISLRTALVGAAASAWLFGAPARAAGTNDIHVGGACWALQGDARAAFETRVKIDLSLRTASGGDLDIGCTADTAQLTWYPREGPTVTREVRIPTAEIPTGRPGGGGDASAPAPHMQAFVDKLLDAAARLVGETGPGDALEPRHGRETFVLLAARAGYLFRLRPVSFLVAPELRVYPRSVAVAVGPTERFGTGTVGVALALGAFVPLFDVPPGP